MRALNQKILCPNCNSAQSWWTALSGMTLTDNIWKCHFCGATLSRNPISSFIVAICFWLIIFISLSVVPRFFSLNFNLNFIVLALIISFTFSVLVPSMIFVFYTFFNPSINMTKTEKQFEKDKINGNISATKKFYSLKYGLLKSMILMALIMFIFLNTIIFTIYYLFR